MSIADKLQTEGQDDAAAHILDVTVSFTTCKEKLSTSI